jgi:hypothetical protein
MRAPPRSKKELLRQVLQGPASIVSIYSATTVRLAVPADPDPKSGIWISFSESSDFILGGVADVFARVGERKVRLTRAEAHRVARFVAKTIHVRARPSC